VIRKNNTPLQSLYDFQFSLYDLDLDTHVTIFIFMKQEESSALHDTNISKNRS